METGGDVEHPEERELWRLLLSAVAGAQMPAD